MDDLLSEFLTETTESLTVLDGELVKLEQNPNDPDLLGNIFRLVHTIKGTCGFLGLPRLESVAHASENVLGKIRDGQLVVTPEAISLVLESLDQIKNILAILEQTEQEPEGDDSDLIGRLNAILEGTDAEPVTAKAADGAPAELEADAAAAKPVADRPESAEPVAAPPESARPESAQPESVQPQPAQPQPAAASEPAPAAAAPPAPAPVPAVPDPKPKAAKAKPPAPQPKPQPKPPASLSRADAGGNQGGGQPGGNQREPSVAAQTIRVHVDLLENLMTMVSELVLTRNQLMQILRNQKDSEFVAPLQRLNHVTSELQEGVMKTRMQPIGNAWAKLPRMVRDLALELGKKIDLQMYGADTELDRQVLDLIKDPLTHMVRNSADHGLEMPDERAIAGKSETGRISLNAYHEGGHIIIEIADDGKGLNVDKIKEKVLQNGLATEAEIDTMSDQQIHMFIFKAGFSTAASVTAVSGRGVGMDVVRTNIEKIGGTIDLRSIRSRGSTFMIKIPLTLAIVNALIVECGGERFAIPQISVEELVRASAHSEHKVERIKDTPVLRLRNRLLPLVHLRRLLKLGEPVDDSAESFIVVTQVASYVFGIIVDRVFDTEEIVVKPVAPILRDIPLFSGNTILGDGSVVMILDPNGIAQATGEMTVSADQAHQEQHKQQQMRSDDLSSLLVFRAGGNAPKAVPLALVARLEEIDLEAVEYSNGKPVVQYRDQLMPIVPIDPSYRISEKGRQPVLVFADREHTMGLLVDEIVDIVEERMSVQLVAEQQGLIGSAIIGGKATDVIDAGFYLTQAFADWFGSDRTAVGHVMASDGRGERVLLVDDSPFFRNLLTPLLSVAGYEVTTVESADEAMKLCDEGEMFAVIISDIEMPGMNGFEFAEAIRNGSHWADVPLVALSSYASEQDLKRGRDVGFSDYVAKFDRDALLETLGQTLSEVQQRGAA